MVKQGGAPGKEGRLHERKMLPIEKKFLELQTLKMSLCVLGRTLEMSMGQLWPSPCAVMLLLRSINRKSRMPSEGKFLAQHHYWSPTLLIWAQRTQ